MSDRETRTFFLDDQLLVSPSQNQLSLGDAHVQLQPKVMAVLCYLAEHHERVISKDELMDVVWEGRVVSQGSVQKSINSLRNGLSVFYPDKEVVTNFSKKGYQLLLEPRFVETNSTNAPTTEEFVAIKEARYKRFFISGFFVAAIIVAAVIFYSAPSVVKISKNHRIQFSEFVGYTNEIGHEGKALVHPSGDFVVYVRDEFNPENLQQTASEIVIRDKNGTDFPLIRTDGSWFKLAWSKDARRLAVVEVMRREGEPLTRNFFGNSGYRYNLYTLQLDLTELKVKEKKLANQWLG